MNVIRTCCVFIVSSCILSPSEALATNPDGSELNVAMTTATPSLSGTPISTHFAGINAWMPYQVGARKYYGILDTKWADVQASGARIMRYGGSAVDRYADPAWADLLNPAQSTLAQYLALVDSMRSQGIEPVLQVPVYGLTYSSAQAAGIVRFVNVTNARAVKYWVIGNEPDLAGGGYGGSAGYTTAAQVAGYFKPFASAMKAVDPSIKIIGPEAAWYDGAVINGLTSCNGGADDITGADSNGNSYVDIVSFHFYDFNGTQTRSQVISRLTQAGGFSDNLTALKARLATCNSYHGRTGNDALQMAITEGNVNYTNPTADGPAGLGAKSFIGGQFWAEMMGIALQKGVDFITFWSAMEGNELGYISSDGNTKRPSYYHLQMVAQNFKGLSVTATDNQANVKVFGAVDVDQIAVMLMNQESSSKYGYTVRLDTGTVSGKDRLKVNVNAGVGAQYSGTISSESTIVLIFDTTGAIKRTIEYKLYGNADANLPPTVTEY
jgi:hypothetical protein